MEDGGLHDGQGDNIRILINLSAVAQNGAVLEYLHLQQYVHVTL